MTRQPGRRAALAAVALLATLAAAGAALAADARRTLTGAEIEARFAAHTVTGRHVLQGYRFRRTYGTDGRLQSFDDGASVPSSGRWWVEGTRLCISWDGFDQPLCRLVVDDGAGRLTKVLVTRTGRRKLIVSYDNFTPGVAASGSQ